MIILSSNEQYPSSDDIMVPWGIRLSHVVMLWPEDDRYIANWKRVDTWRGISRDHCTARRTLVAHDEQTRLVFDEVLIIREVARVRTQNSTEDRRKFAHEKPRRGLLFCYPELE